MTETKIKKFDGKHVRFEINKFAHSVEIETKEGIMETDSYIVAAPRDGRIIQKTHVGFWLFPANGKPEYFDYRRIKLIRDNTFTEIKQ